MEALIVDAYALYVERIGRPPAPMLADWKSIACSGAVTLAWRGSEVVGLIELVIQDDAVLVESIAVSPVLQGEGLGSRLLRHAEDVARGRGLPQLRLYTNRAMTENLSFYPKRGFVEVARRADGGYHRVYFIKELRADQ